MAWTVDLLYEGFVKIIEDPNRFLEDDFMIDEMWAPIANKIPPFRDFLTHMYDEHSSNKIAHSSEDEKTLPYNELRQALFYPTQRGIAQSTELSLQLAVVIATTMRAEFVNTTKNTARYLSAIGGVSSLTKISEEQRVAGFGVDASNSVSESVHAASTDMLVVFGTIHAQYCAAIGQSRFNNDFGRAHKNLVRGQKNTSKRKKIKYTGANSIGSFHKLSANAQTSLIRFAKEHAKNQKEKVDGYLKEQFQDRMDKAMKGREKNLDEAMETYIDALFCLKLYHSPRRWWSAAQARREFAALPSDARRLAVAKQQLLIYVNGLEIEDAHHPWTKEGHTYTGHKLLEWIINTAMPLAKELEKKWTAACGTHRADEELARSALSRNYVGSSGRRRHFGEGGNGKV